MNADGTGVRPVRVTGDFEVIGAPAWQPTRADLILEHAVSGTAVKRTGLSAAV